MAFNYSSKEFIKMYRKLLDWEWYKNVNTKTLFIHCLLRANWKPGSWHGINYNAGDFITSLPSLAEETGLTVRQVRVALDHLIMTGEVTSSSTDPVTGKKIPRARIITVVNWGAYQVSDRQNGRQTTGKTSSKRQDNDRQVTVDIRSKEDKKLKKEKEEPLASLPLDSSDEEMVWEDPQITLERFRNERAEK